MQIVKLHATTSTNDELKARLRESETQHLTAIYSLSQSQGRGNRGSVWHTEDGKNLTFSVLVSDNLSGLTPFKLNQIVSVAMIEWLKSDLNVQARIKWPNDILSVQMKLAGILIENTYQKGQWIHSIVGIGLNVNQEEFENLPRAISLKNLTGKNFKLEELLLQFLFHLDYALKNRTQTIEKYLKFLFKYRQEMNFSINNQDVVATVHGVTENGELLLQKDGQINAYDLKQVQWNY
ncbi:biotin-protein ligase [Nonlabens ulvanivorans]|uniref:Biotin-protein ligase n=1 Tax=Nonlabens ulvanivorans TaxID=906888 RepID=A0A090WGC6_NONUL|nr:biotin--[acetyl-CoA-carboxylase] ligase [Nonlabens ulvanivorans]GAL74449.1 biotin-protein ligase [Nonlabens ulvanivorans]